MIRVGDALGDVVVLPAPARRIVSLIPSITETLFALGCGDRVIGRTTWCIHPASGVATVPTVGGTKDPDVDRIRALAPDLILANKEENRLEDVARLRHLAPVHVSYPRTLDGLLDHLGELGVLLGERGRTDRLRDEIAEARVRFHAHPRTPRLGCIYLIWRKPWMAASSDTFIDAMLEETGFQNVARSWGGRYPVIDLARAASADVVLLASEPFPFTEAHRAEVASAAGISKERVICVSGEAFSWFGSRTRDSFAEAARVHAQAGR